MRENGFKLKKERSRGFPALTITGADYADDIALLAQAKTLLHSLEWSAAGIGLHINTDKMKFTRFNQRSDIFTQNGNSLNLVDKFT